MRARFRKWLDLGWALDQNRKLVCPSCGELAIEFQYVGDLAKRSGYLDVWCAACLKGVHVYIAHIPYNVPVLDINGPTDVIAARIPHFTWVLPED
jgi:hypothetical protein